VYFNDPVLCRSLSSWQCRGDGYDDTTIIMVGTPTEVGKALNGMEYISTAYGIDDTISVTLFDGASEDLRNFCLTKSVISRSRQRNVLTVTEGLHMDSHQAQLLLSLPTSIAELGSTFDACYNSSVSIHVHVSELQRESYASGGTAGMSLLDGWAGAIITWAVVVLVLLGIIRGFASCWPYCMRSKLIDTKVPSVKREGDRSTDGQATLENPMPRHPPLPRAPPPPPPLLQRRTTGKQGALHGNNQTASSSWSIRVLQCICCLSKRREGDEVHFTHTPEPGPSEPGPSPGLLARLLNSLCQTSRTLMCFPVHICKYAVHCLCCTSDEVAPPHASWKDFEEEGGAVGLTLSI